MRPNRRTLGIVATFVSLIAALCYLVRLGHGGLALRLIDAEGALLAAYRESNLDTFRIDSILALTPGPIRARWEGYWMVPSPGFSELVLKTDGRATVHLDGAIAIESTAADGSAVRVARRLDAGVHPFSVSYDPSATGSREIFLKGITASGASIAVERERLRSSPPSWWEDAVRILGWILACCGVVLWTFWLVSERTENERTRLTSRTPALLLCAVLLIAAALRFEALVRVYWGIEAPPWAEELAADIQAARPGLFEHLPTPHPYEGDPFSYLGIARSMDAFYAPSPREPFFPALTRLALFFSNGRDIGINFLSAICSTLTCLAIFALGRRLQSSWTGLMAAFVWATGWQDIAFSVQGWRDDLFTLQVTACAAGFIGLRESPTRRASVLLGVLAGLTLLTRLTAFSFLIPALVAVVLVPGAVPRRERLYGALRVALIMMLLAGPFMAACAIGFGDPFHAVNVHAAFYRSRAGLEGAGSSSVSQLFSQLLSPWEFIETGFTGLTSLPFNNKFDGSGAIVPGLNSAARALALLGAPILIWRANGWLFFIILFSSIAPYAWTWNIPGGGEWRFTLPALPFYLVSAALALDRLVRGLKASTRAESRIPAFQEAWAVALTLLVLSASGLLIAQRLQWLRVADQLDHGKSALIEPGLSSRAFFRYGWTRRGGTAGAPVFEMSAAEALLRLPVPSAQSVTIVLRLGASSNLTPVHVFLQGRKLMSLAGPKGREEQSVIAVDASLSRASDILELRLVREESEEVTEALNLLWLRVEPLTKVPPVAPGPPFLRESPDP